MSDDMRHRTSQEVISTFIFAFSDNAPCFEKTLPIHISFLTTLFIIVLVKIYIITDPQEYADVQFTTRHKVTTPKPIFVIKTYYYPNSKSFNGKDAVVTIFNGERLKYKHQHFECNRTLASGKSERSRGKVFEIIYGPRQCKLTVFRLTCLFPARNEELADFNVGLPSPETGVMQYGALTVSQPNKKPYGFVSCMSRMIAFDDWALIIFAMETFRLYGGDLVVAPVECAIKEVMQLLRLYEDDGILRVTGGFHARKLPNSYDPNTETEYSNQMSSSHECFYHYKESAEFIAFTDWDDILVGYRSGSYIKTFYEAFSPFIETHPYAAAFTVNRIDAYQKPPMRKTDRTFSLGASFRKTHYVAAFLDEKMVIRPHLVAGCWIHEMKIAEDDKYHQIAVNGSVATLLHLHDTIAGKGERPRMPADARIIGNASEFVDANALDANFGAMVQRHSFSFNHQKYPYYRLFHSLIYRCYKNIDKEVQTDSILYCPTYKSCTYPAQNVKVVKLWTEYNEPIVTGPYVWHERRSVKFVNDNKGCL